MRWTVFAFVAYVMLAVELGLRRLFAVGSDQIAPSFMLIYMVFIASLAPSWPTMWAALILGGLVDLTAGYSRGEAIGVVLGPYALGYLLGALLTIELRTIVYRRHPLTMMLQTLAAGLAIHLLVTCIFTVRHILGLKWSAYAVPWSASDELFRRFLELLYTAALALPLGWLLTRVAPLFSFQSHTRVRHMR